MKQEKFDDYVAKMGIVLDEVRNDFSKQLQTNSNTQCIKYKIIVSPVDITLFRETERKIYIAETNPLEYVDETRTARLDHSENLFREE